MLGFSVFFFILTDHTCHRHCRPFPSVKDYRLQCIRISLSPPWPLFGKIFWHQCSGASPFSNLYLRNLTAKKARLQSMQQIFYRKRNFRISYKNTRTEEDVCMPTMHCNAKNLLSIINVWKVMLVFTTQQDHFLAKAARKHLKEAKA